MTLVRALHNRDLGGFFVDTDEMSIPKILTARLSSSFTTTASAPVSGLSLPVKAGRTYIFRFYCITRTSNVANAANLTVTGPTFTTFAMANRVALTATTEAVGYSTGAYPSYVATASAAPSTSDLLEVMEGLIIPSVDGDLSLLMRSNGGAVATILAGSSGELIQTS